MKLLITHKGTLHDCHVFSDEESERLMEFLEREFGVTFTEGGAPAWVRKEHSHVER